MFCLRVPSDPAWAERAVGAIDDVLVDHAHCEMKAASNALSLAARHPDDIRLVRALTDLAKEEIDHFQRVLGLLAERGLALGPPPVDEYAVLLRKASVAAPRGKGPSSSSPLVGRLLVGALIEARSCERFKLLLGCIDRVRDADLHAFYTELFAAEARHYRTFVDLAIAAAGGDEAAVVERLEALSVAEAEIVTKLALSKTRNFIHG